MNTIDAKGLSCPEPVILAQRAHKNYANKAFTIEVDSPTAKQNVIEYLEKNGRTLDITDTDTHTIIKAMI